MRSLTIWRIVRLSLDCVITVALLIVVMNFLHIFKYRGKRGFFCDDESLKYPYQTDSMGGRGVLHLMSLYGPAIAIVVAEGLLYMLQRTRLTTNEEPTISTAFWKLHYNLTSFLGGFAMHALFVQLTKIYLGRLRPHFFAVCQPYRRLDGTTCDNPKNHGVYIQDYECNGKNNPNISQHMLDNVHLSFPSSHASCIFYAMIFIILYLQRVSKTLRQYKINVGLFMLVIQMSCVLLAWLTSVSRVMDYKHHWSDVLVGIVLGASVAIAASLFAHQQLSSVNSWPEGVKSSSSHTTVTTATTMPNAILVSS